MIISCTHTYVSMNLSVMQVMAVYITALCVSQLSARHVLGAVSYISHASCSQTSAISGVWAWTEGGIFRAPIKTMLFVPHIILSLFRRPFKGELSDEVQAVIVTRIEHSEMVMSRAGCPLDRGMPRIDFTGAGS